MSIHVFLMISLVLFFALVFLLSKVCTDPLIGLGAIFAYLVLVLGVIAFNEAGLSTTTEVALSEYFYQVAESEMKDEDIKNIILAQDENIEVIDLKIFNIPGTLSSQVTVKVRAGNAIYGEYELKYLISNANNERKVEIL